MAGAWLAGLVGGIIVVFSVSLIDSVRIDDPVGAFSVHGVCGIWGTVVVGLWGYAVQGTGAGIGLFTGGGIGQLWIQIVGCIAYAVWTVVTCYVTWKVIGAAFGGIRVTEEQEKIGLDITEHGIEAYPDYAMSGSGVGNR
jgi:Amt family ammonium transporter